MESKACELCWLNTKIFESLRRWVNLLVNELSLNFIGRKDGPPESLVEKTSDRFEDTFWKVDVSSMLDDFFVY